MEQIVVDHGHTRDPHRRWIRHTFQEGPGFLFLATRGGRPPKQLAERSELAEIRRRARVLRVAREDGIAAALALGECSRASLFRWHQHTSAAVWRRCVPFAGGRAAAGYPGWTEQVVIA